MYLPPTSNLSFFNSEPSRISNGPYCGWVVKNTSSKQRDTTTSQIQQLELCDKKIPVVVLSGFLGAGKTTVLNHILENVEDSEKIAVVVNDMASVNIDAEMVKNITSENTIELQNGCICCTLREDLIEGIASLVSRHPTLCRIVVESTGISEPLPVAMSFTDPRLEKIVFLDELVTVIDTSSYMTTFTDSKRKLGTLLSDQTTHATTILLNKIDLATPSEISATISLIKYLNPTCVVYEVRHGAVPLHHILSTSGYNVSKYLNTPAWVAEQNQPHTPETEGYSITSFTYGPIHKPIPHEVLSKFHSELPTQGLFRAKGWIFTDKNPSMRIGVSVSGVGKVDMTINSRWRCEELAEMERVKKLSSNGKRVVSSIEEEVERLKARGAWCETYGDRRQELVFIGREPDGFDPALIEAFLNSLFE